MKNKENIVKLDLWGAANQQEKERQYWLAKLSGDIVKTVFSYDYIHNKKEIETSLECAKFTFTGELFSGLKRLSRESDYALYIILIANLVLLLYKYTGNRDIMVGTPIYKQELEKEFINTVLVLRILIQDKMTFKELLLQVRETVNEAEEHQNYPIEVLLTQLNISYAAGEFPLFDVALLLENIHDRKYLHTVKTNVVFSFLRTEEQIEGQLDYNPLLYNSNSIERIRAHFATLLQKVLAHLEVEVSRIDILSEGEREKLLFDFNNTKVDYPEDKTIQQLFNERVAKNTDRIALVTRSEGENCQISYKELDDESIRLAYLLIKKGVGPDTLVGIILERSIEMLVAVFAVLKAGGAYLPIDPSYPQERKAYILRDSGAAVLLTGRSVCKEGRKSGRAEARKNTIYEVETIFLDDCWSESTYSTETSDQEGRGEPCVHPSIYSPVKAQSAKSKAQSRSYKALRSAPCAVHSAKSPENLAYVIYTSGSTGNPKGVVIEQHSVVNMIYALHSMYPFAHSDTYLLKTTFVFDVSVTELFGWFLGSGRLAILEKGGEINPKHILNTIENMQITHINFVPSMFNVFLDEINPGNIKRLSTLKYIFLAGEALLPGLIDKFRSLDPPAIQLENIYGPTEGTIYSSAYSLSGWQSAGNIPIGKPMQNTRLYVLDRANNIQPIGVAGELCIAGVGLARGYLNNPEFTAERFVSAKRIAKSEELLARPEAKTKPTLPLRGTPPVEGNPEHFIVSSLKVQSARSPLERGGPPQAGRGVLKSSQQNKLFTHSNIEEKSEEFSASEAVRYALCDYAERSAAENKEVSESQAVPHHSSFIPHHSALLYKTGDLARWLPDGNIEFLGRIDHQVKIRGFRIELGEIERHLLKHGAVKVPVVVAKEDKNGDRYLCAYIVAKHLDQGAGSAENTSLPSVLREHLSRMLPDYMIPSYFIQVDKLPLTPTGKLDRKLLPEVEIMPMGAYQAPRNIIEDTLVGIWSEVLRITREKIGIDTHFFHSGGHSLNVLSLITLIHKKLNVEVPMFQIFRQPTIRGLAKYISIAKGSVYSGIQPQEKREYYPMSPAQKRMYLLNQIEGQNINYNLPAAMIVEGQLHITTFQEVFEKIIVRHEVLRTSFHLYHNQPLQRVHDRAEFKIHYHTVMGTETRTAESLLIETFILPFDLSQVPLLRVALAKLEEERWLLMCDMHHIISDGASIGVLTRDFTALYAGAELPPLKVQYKDYTLWCHSERERLAFKQQEEYWLQNFADRVPVLDIPLDYPRPVIQSFAGSTVSFRVGEEEMRALRECSRSAGATLYMVLLALYNVFLSKICSQKDIVVGTAAAGRKHAECEHVIGMFVNTLALRNYPEPEKTFRGFLQEVKEQTLEAFRNQDYQFEELVEKIAVKRDVSRNPLFDVMFSFDRIEQNIRGESGEPGFKITPYELESKISKFDLTLSGFEAQESLYFTFEYCSELFKEDTIKRFTSYFKKIIADVREWMDRTIGEIDIIPNEEKKQVLYDFNDTETGYPDEKTIHHLFTEQAAKIPDYIAIVGETIYSQPAQEAKSEVRRTDRVSLTYRELNRAADCLAGILTAKGVTLDTITAITIKRSVEMIIGILGILKAGSAYLPIALGWPEERIRYMLVDSSARLLLTTRNIFEKGEMPGMGEGKPLFLEEVEKFRSLEVETIFIEECRGEPCVHPSMYSPDLPDRECRGESMYSPVKAHSAKSKAQSRSYRALRSASCTVHSAKSPENLAYAIYTSGSTGRPKGVLVDHRALVNLCYWHNRHYEVTEKDKAAQYADISFDASVWEIFPYLVKGAVIHIICDEIKLDIHGLNEYFGKNKITVTFLPTQMYEQFMYLDNSTLRILLTGGDKLRLYTRKNYKLYNNYGPTENCVVSTAYRVNKNCHNIPIGKPVDNNRIYILAQGMLQLQPVGVAGELCISGVGLARGYLNKPESTAERFVNYKLQNTNYKQITNYKFKIKNPGLQITKKYEKDDDHTIQIIENKEVSESQAVSHHSSFILHHSALLYKTGDMARWLPDGNIEFLGRIDQQVKIRGFRIELGEIASQLLQHDAVKEAVVITREDETGGNHICAYVVTSNKDIPALMQPLDGEWTAAVNGDLPESTSLLSDLREHLSQTLPNYMVPSHFVLLEKIPFTRGGKIDYSALPDPVLKPGKEYIAPRNPTEEKLVNIWSLILGINRPVGIDEDFFESGGHSLKAAIMAARIHRELNVKIPVVEIFKHPTIRGLSSYIKKSEKDICQSIQPLEEKEYYPASSAQKRMFVLKGIKGEQTTSDSLPRLMCMEGDLDLRHFEETSKMLIKRHEALRTSFALIDDNIVQRVHKDVDFEIEYSIGQTSAPHPGQPIDGSGSVGAEAGTLNGPGVETQRAVYETIERFIRPFDLGNAPLFRVGLIKVSAAEHILMFDMHHIITDGTSMGILVRDFISLYEGVKPPGLRIHYKDFTLWQNQILKTEDIKKQEEYWLSRFPDKNDIPVLNLPGDFPRPAVQIFEGSTIEFAFDDKLTQEIKALVTESKATLFIVLLTIYNILLYQYSGQEDIVVGVPVQGRQHPDLENTVGFFVNTLAMRNRPQGEKSFRKFLDEVKTNALNAYDNQDYQFEELVARLGKQPDPGRQVLFDTMFEHLDINDIHSDYQYKEKEIAGKVPGKKIGKLAFKPYKYESKIIQFDLLLHAFDLGDTIGYKLLYSTILFRRKTIARFIRSFKEIADIVTGNMHIKLNDIKVSHSLIDKKISDLREDKGDFVF